MVQAVESSAASTSSALIEQPMLTDVASSSSQALPDHPLFLADHHPGPSQQMATTRGQRGQRGQRKLMGRVADVSKRNKRPEEQIKADKEAFLKEWKQKKLNDAQSAQDLAKKVWNLDGYRQESVGMGRFAAEIVKDNRSPRYVADYTTAMTRIHHAYAQKVKDFKGDESIAAMDPATRENFIRQSAMEHFLTSKQLKRPPRPNEIRKLEEDTRFVGRVVRAQMASKDLDLHKMTIEEIEAKTRKLKVHPHTDKKSMLLLHNYLRKTRNMQESDFNVFRRNRKLHWQAQRDGRLKALLA